MESIDRSKYKAKPVAELKKQEIETNEKIGYKGDEDWLKYLTIKEGDNKFRIYPAREPDESWIYPKTVSFLPFDVEVESKEKGSKSTTKIERKMKPIFNSRVHGNTEKDIIEAYINLAVEKLKAEIKDSDKLKAKMGIIHGYKDKHNKFHSGINPQTKWTVMADKYEIDGKTFGLVDFTPGTKENMNKLAAIEDNSEAICTDPFTDVEDGICLILNYNPSATKNSDYYTPSLEIKKIDKFNQQLVPTPLTDDDLANWLKYPSLKEKFVNSYKKSDFEKAMEGLELFDKENLIGVFDLKEWDDIVAEIEAYYPEETTKESAAAEETNKELEEKHSTKSFESKSEPEVIEGLELVSDLMDLDKDDLTLLIKKKQYPIVVKPAYDKDDILMLIQAYLESKKEEAKEEPKEEAKEEVKTPTLSRAERMKQLKEDQLNNKK